MVSGCNATEPTMFNPYLAVAHLIAKATNHSQSRCAQYVREALAAGGIKLPIVHFAKDLGPHLVRAGFSELFVTQLTTLFPVAGDVVVIQPHTVRIEGHIAMSDFHQDPNGAKPDKGL